MQTDRASHSLSGFEKQVHDALSLWHKSAVRGSPLDQLLIVKQALRETGGNQRLATNQVLHRALSLMAAQHADLAGLLRMRFLDRMTVHALANQRNLADATLYVQQNRAIRLLAAVMHDMEHTARSSFQSSLEARLPAPGYTSLIGVSASLERLLQLVESPRGPSLLLLEGIGGIGKTSLAHELVRRAMERLLFDDIIWITAQQQYLRLDGTIKQVTRSILNTEDFIDELSDHVLPGSPERYDRARAVAALHDRLAHTPCLIVVDNLEMVEDPDRLFSLLRQLAGGSRFVAISRHCHYDEPDMFHFGLTELAEPDALSLVRQEAAHRNLPDLASASDTDLKPVFKIAGGNPLALRLIVGQVHVRPLPAVLSDLTAARGKSTEALYTYIYRNAWDGLDESCRRILLAMPLVAEAGAAVDYLSQISSIQIDELTDGLSILVHRNLVDSRGDLMQRRYAIHNLTRSFLLEQVIRWQA